jgi:alpha-D-xyloside xylohydrolase
MIIRRKPLKTASVRPALPGFARLRGAAVLGAIAAFAAAGTAFADDAFEYKLSDAGLQIKAGNLTKNIEVYGDKGRTLRVTANLNGVSHAKHPSISVITKPVKANFTLKQDAADSVTFASPAITVKVEKSTGALTFTRPDGKVILAEKSGVRPEIKEVTISDAPTYDVKQTFTLQPNEAIYGLGQAIRPNLNYRGKEILIVQANIPAYTNVLTSSNDYGILWDICSQSIFKDDRNGMSIWSESAPAGVDYYLMTGDNLDGVITEYRKLTGDAPMFPRQAYGFFMSKERYSSQKELIGMVESFRKDHYPLDFIVQDWQYWTDRDGNWTSMTWDPERYPDPKAMCDTIHNDLHAKILISIWPTVGLDCDVGRELKAKNLLFDPPHWIRQGRVYDAYSQEGREIYFKHVKKGLLDVGVDATWMDGTEVETRSACHDQRAMIRDIKENGINAMGDFTRYLNSYSLMTTMGCYEGQRATSDKRVLTLTRSAWAGQQRYAALSWSGDTTASWARLKEDIVGGLSASLSGLPYWTQDTGGFFSGGFRGINVPEYQELLARWNQFAIFNPVYRWHGTGFSKEPWRFKDIAPEAYQSYLSAAKLRYRLMPYIYSLGWMTTKDHYTMTRPLVMDFPDSPGATTNESQFMFGPAFLAQPVTRSLIQVSRPRPPVIDASALTTPDGAPGVKIEYFNDERLRRKVSEAVEKVVDLSWPGPPLVNWPEGLRNGDHFSARLTGFITAPEDGKYEIGVSGDDGFRLWLDDKLVVEDWNSADARYKSTDIELKKGQKVAFRLDYYQNLYTRELKLCWRTPAELAKYAAEHNDTAVETKLPVGAKWFDFFTNELFDGGRTLSRECPLDRFPLFVRAGSIVPFNGEDTEYATQKTTAPMEIRVYPGANAKFTLHEDDNETYAYEKGQFADITFTWDDASSTLKIGKRDGSFPGMDSARKFRATIVRDGKISEGKTVDYNGSEVSVKL